ncbi:hypothetical protein ABID29_002220 [Streptococcus rupicaprae]|uniref:ATPase AAA-type core domain-containing protein n=1 Tax=Streptococcus rupicaprae TaxID=759619 RepID=A0ABV2FKK2_9STRE
MKLIALVIEKFGDVFEKQALNFSDEFRVEVDDDDWDNIELRLNIEKKSDYLENFYEESIYNITPIVGINGTGKTSLINSIGYYHRNGKNSTKNSQFIRIYLTETNELVFDGNLTKEISLKENQFFSTIKPISYSYPREKTLIKNIPLLRDTGRGTFGGANGIEVEYNLDSFPPIFRAYDDLYRKEIISSELRVYLESTFYKAKEVIAREKLTILPKKDFWENAFTYHIVILYYDEVLNSKMTTHITDLDDLLSDRLNSLCFIKKILSDLKTDDAIYKIFNQLKSLREIIDKWVVESFQDDYGENNYLTYDISQSQLYDDIYNSYKAYEAILSSYNIYVSNLLSNIELSMSQGEINLIKLAAHILSAIEKSKDDYKDVIFVIDEIEVGMHLEWSRRLIKFLIDYISEKKKEPLTKNPTSDFPTFQFIFTTHSPYMLSDIKPGNIIALKRKAKYYSEVQSYQNTFAKNIQEIIHDDMFIGNIYGEFAVGKLNNLIEHLNSKELYQEPLRIEQLKKEVSLIAEPLIKQKLEYMYYKKYTETKIPFLEEISQLDDLTQEQKEIIKKLYHDTK